LAARRLIMFVQRQQRPVDAQLAQQAGGVAGVFRGNDVGACQHFACAGRQIREIADRRRDEFDSPLSHPIILSMQPPRHATFRTLVAGALLVLISACATAPSGPGPASESRAERLLRQGNLVEAATMYEDLANNNGPPARDEFSLAAARAW